MKNAVAPGGTARHARTTAVPLLRVHPPWITSCYCAPPICVPITSPETTISTLLFFWRPSAVLLSATGRSMPNPLAARAQTWGLADLYVNPLQLGWHAKQADAIASYAFFAPTGRYTVGTTDNTGLGMWSNEFSVGTTIYLDKTRKAHVAGTGYYEVHSSKKDLDYKVGDIFTLEGGAGMDFLKGYANAGLAYVGQWKVTEDTGTDVNLLVKGKKGSLFSLGPELNMPVGKRGVFLGFKYLFDTRSRLATSGNYLVLNLTYIKPSN